MPLMTGSAIQSASGGCRRIRVVWLAIAGLVAAIAATAARAEPDGKPCTLLLALDGMPHRVVERAQADGAFDGWSRVSRLVSTFPSTTHVAFASLFQPLGVLPSDGYELRYFDREQNRMTGGSPVGYQQQAYDWKAMLDVKRKSMLAKLLVYTSPKTTASRELKKIRKAVLGSDLDTILAHVGSTDAMGHLRGDEAMLKFMLRLETMLGELQSEYSRIHGRPLRIVLYSDHGNSDLKVRKVHGLPRRLKDAGFRVTKKLKRLDDVVAPTFGIVSFGALFTYADRAERAATAVVGHEGVDLAFWLAAEARVEVLSDEGRATIHWHEIGGRRRIRYEPGASDPLRLGPAVTRLGSSGRIDPAGYADAESWFRETADAEYPDALNRVIDAFADGRVASPATVLLSLEPGYAWGWRSAHVMARIQGGKVEGTHGGLDRGSTLGFWMTNDAALDAPAAHRAARALADFADDYERSAKARGLPAAD
jgi:hypothetical protein